MPDFTMLLAFSLVALGMVLTPGPNMIYLVSRSLCQGRQAGFVSLAGVGLAFVFYMLSAAFGITALFFAVPYAYDALRIAGALYLLWLAWQSVKPGGRSAFSVKELPADKPRRLFVMGFLTSIANPKVAVMYLSLLPQFIVPGHGSVLTQSLIFGTIQMCVSISINALIITMAGSVSGFMTGRPLWQVVQRWLMGTVLAGLAVRMVFEARR